MELFMNESVFNQSYKQKRMWRVINLYLVVIAITMAVALFLLILLPLLTFMGLGCLFFFVVLLAFVPPAIFIFVSYSTISKDKEKCKDYIFNGIESQGIIKNVERIDYRVRSYPVIYYMVSYEFYTKDNKLIEGELKIDNNQYNPILMEKGSLKHGDRRPVFYKPDNPQDSFLDWLLVSVQ